MAIATRHLFLLAYDIADPRRLNRVHRTVKAAGIAVQYSVFLVPGRAEDIDRLLAALDRIIDPRADDVRVYPLPRRLYVYRYGKQSFPEGIALFGSPELEQAMQQLLVGNVDETSGDDRAKPARASEHKAYTRHT